jgi:hypothetical protein
MQSKYLHIRHTALDAVSIMYSLKWIPDQVRDDAGDQIRDEGIVEMKSPCECLACTRAAG